MNYFKKIETIVIIILILVMGAAYGALHSKKDERAANNKERQESQEVKEEYTTQVPSSLVSYKGQEGRNALDVLKSNYNVQTKSFGDLGEFVQSINGVEPDNKHFWAMYVNGEVSQVGAGSYITKSTDTVEWKLEEIK